MSNADVRGSNRAPIETALEYLIPNTNSEPIIVRGSGCMVEDEDGKTYLDFEGGPGVVSVGHCHPRVVRAVEDQAKLLLQSPGRFHSRLMLDLSQRISGLTDAALKRVFIANSGAEAADGAIKLAMKHATITGKRGYGIIALEHSFHGRLSVPLSMTGNPGRKKGFGPYASFPGVVHVPAPYFYRCSFGSRTPEECGNHAVKALRNALVTRVPGEAAVMIGEPVLGVGGVIVPPDNYWRQIAEICAENKILLVHDEVFTGFGRTGRIFAHQHWGVLPDIMTFAKAIGGGLPLGGFIASNKVGLAFEDGDHFTTFGSNNQVGLAAALAVLDILHDEDLPGNAFRMGEHLLEGFRRLQSKHAPIGDVRGKGLMIGLEIVKNRTSKEPDAALTKRLANKLRDLGLIVGITGNFGCVLRMTPPLVLKRDEADEALKIFAKAFAEVLH